MLATQFVKQTKRIKIIMGLICKGCKAKFIKKMSTTFHDKRMNNKGICPKNKEICSYYDIVNIKYCIVLQ